MRKAQQLIRLILGDADFDGVEARPAPGEGSGFQQFVLHLKEARYRGFPDTWNVAIRERPEQRPDPKSVAALVHEAKDICRRAISLQNRKQPHPMLLVSDDPAVRLAGHLRFRGELVFSIDARNLPDRPPEDRVSFRFSPLVTAVRSKLDRHELSRFLLAPYQPHDPAVGWRFFGREAELEQLIETDSNFFVVGPRRVGKTSLLQESKRRLEAKGAKVFMIACQDKEEPSQVVDEIVRSLDARTVVTVKRRSQMLDDSMLSSVLRTVTRKHRKVVLVLDELGNAIRKRERDPWQFMGALREHSQSGNLRIIMSGWQQIYRRQGEFESPFVNFAAVLPLKGFKDKEIRECLIDPLSLWGTIRDRDALRHRVVSSVGRQPFLLQYFGAALYSRILEDGEDDIDTLAERLLEEDALEVFLDAVEEIFFRFMPSPLQRYLFLACCREAELKGTPLHTAELTDTWIRSKLLELGLSSTHDQRREVLEALELRGLTAPVGQQVRRHHIAAPIAYVCIKESNEPIDELIEILAEEIDLPPKDSP